MPVYQYECDVCGMRFELRRHFGESHPMICPAGHKDVHRVFAAPTIIFKGSGFYVTDHGRNGNLNQQSSSSKDQKSPKPEKQTATPAKAGEGA
jgi:putative FmdB family regulatory protein